MPKKKTPQKQTKTKATRIFVEKIHVNIYIYISYARMKILYS